MFLEKLRLFCFRNFSEQLIDFKSGTNIFLGMNGQGKSNILEAIYILLTGESFRPSENLHFVQWGQASTSVQARFTDFVEKSVDIQFKIQQERKVHFFEKRKFQTADYLTLPVPVLFSPESLTAIKGSSDERRQLVDELILTLHPEQRATFADLRKILRMRNRLLKDYLQQKADKFETLRLLDALNVQYLELNVNWAFQRISVLNSVQDTWNESLSRISTEFPRSEFSYVISEENFIHNSHQDIHNILHKRLLELQAAEFAAGHSLVGCHKHEIVFLFGGNDSRFFCSQGQQRSLILAFKMAQIVYHGKVSKQRSILLLDDVLSELDGDKRKTFVNFLKEIDSQIVMTSTDYDLPHFFGTAKDRVYSVKQGAVESVSL